MRRPEPWNDWCENVGELPPIGSILQRELHPRWARIHDVPENGDASTTFSPHRRLASASLALGIGAQCLVFVTTRSPVDLGGSWSDCPLPAKIVDRFDRSRTSQTKCRRVTWGLPDAIETIAALSPPTFDGHLAVLSEGTGAIYCPFANGADLFMRPSTVVRALRWIIEERR